MCVTDILLISIITVFVNINIYKNIITLHLILNSTLLISLHYNKIVNYRHYNINLYNKDVSRNKGKKSAFACN